MRKDWDYYFLNIAREVSLKSKCLSRKIGAVLVKDKAIISTGYNGPPREVHHCNERSIKFYKKADLNNTMSVFTITPEQYRKPIKECPRRLFGYKSGQGLHLCQAGHAERNTLIQAARNGISTLGTTLYCWCGQVCKDCAIEMINAGVKRLVHLEGPEYDGYSKTLLTEGNIEIKLYNAKNLSHG